MSENGNHTEALTPEQTLLGEIFFVNISSSPLGVADVQAHTLASVTSLIAPADFADDRHRMMWEAMLHLSAQQIPIELNTICTELRSKGVWEVCGGVAYIGQLVACASEHVNVEHWAREIKKASVLRQLAIATGEISKDAKAKDALSDVPALLAQAEAKVLTITRMDLGDSEPPFAQEMDQVLDTIFRGELAGISTRFLFLDQALTAGGFSRGSLNVLAAATSVGKTSLATEILIRARSADERDAAGLFLSIEMSRSEMFQRLIATEGEVDWSEIASRRPPIPVHSERERILAARERLTAKRIELFQHKRLTPADVQRRARLAAQKFGGQLDLLVIDYLQLMDPDEPYHHQSRTLEVASITKELKNIANEFNCAVLLLSQLNRESVRHEDNEPQLHHLRDSGAIEQDADVVIFMWETRRGTRFEDRPAEREINWKIAKQRNGIKVILPPLRFQIRHTKFVE